MGQSDFSNRKIFTIKEVSEYLRLPVSTVYFLVKKGKLRARKFGKHWRVLESDIVNNPADGRQVSFPADSAEPPNRRRHPRLNTEISSDLSIQLTEKSSALIRGLIRNLSASGIYFEWKITVAADALPKAGDPVQLTFVVPGLTPTCLVMEGRVVRFSESKNPGIGIKFRNPSLHDQEIIVNYVG